MSKRRSSGTFYVSVYTCGTPNQNEHLYSFFVILIFYLKIKFDPINFVFIARLFNNLQQINKREQMRNLCVYKSWGV